MQGKPSSVESRSRENRCALSVPEHTVVSVVMLLAFVLRLIQLEFQSLWWDEGISLYLAGHGLPALTYAKDFAIDLHPPFYHLLLAIWTTSAGTSVFASRALSLFLGVLTVPMAYVLVRAVFGRGAALITALLLVFSPMHIFYSQEVRMYSLLPLIGVLSIEVARRILTETEQVPARRWLALGLVNAIGLYSYYYHGMLVLAENAAFIVVLATTFCRGSAVGGKSADIAVGQAEAVDSSRQRLTLALPPVRAWLLAQGLTLALFLPWMTLIPEIFRSGAADIPGEFATPWSLLGFARECILAFSIGFARPSPWADAATLCTGLLAVVGLLGASRDRAGWWLVVLGLGVSAALSFALTLYRPFFYPRFIIGVLPLYYALAAYGLVRVGRAWRPLAVACLIGLLAASGVSLQLHYTSPRTAYASSDYRSVLDKLDGVIADGDLVLVEPPWLGGYLTAYLPNRSLQPVHLTDWDPPAVEKLLIDHGRAWVLAYSEERRWSEGPLEQQLELVGHPLYVDWQGDTRVRLFAVDPKPVLGQTEPVAVFDGTIALLGYRLEPEGVIIPGEDLALALCWRAVGPVSESYTVFVHLLGPDGTISAQSDSPPLAGARPTDGWSPVETIVDRHRLVIPADAPAGEYLVQIGLYQPISGKRLEVGRSPEEIDRLILGRPRLVR